MVVKPGDSISLTLKRIKDCSVCGGEILELPEVISVPLFRHAGYGEAVRIRSEICLGCWNVRELSRESLNPRPYVD